MQVSDRFRGRQTQFHIELLYGVLFIAGFAYLVFRIDPRVAAFEGGLVIGYLFRVWEKMSIYERILEEVVSEEAETKVADEVEEQVSDEVAHEIEEQVGEEVTTEVEQQVGDVDERIGRQIDERIDEEIDQVDERIEDLEERQVTDAAAEEA